MALFLQLVFNGICFSARIIPAGFNSVMTLQLLFFFKLRSDSNYDIHDLYLNDLNLNDLNLNDLNSNDLNVLKTNKSENVSKCSARLAICFFFLLNRSSY